MEDSYYILIYSNIQQLVQQQYNSSCTLSSCIVLHEKLATGSYLSAANMTKVFTRSRLAGFRAGRK